MDLHSLHSGPAPGHLCKSKSQIERSVSIKINNEACVRATTNQHNPALVVGPLCSVGQDHQEGQDPSVLSLDVAFDETS